MWEQKGEFYDVVLYIIMESCSEFFSFQHKDEFDKSKAL